MTLSNTPTGLSPTSPLVSVVVPTFNRADVLPRTLQSVLSQTFSDIELIVVDDGSTDRTSEVLHNLTDDRLHYIQLPHNCGGNYARHHVIPASRADFVSFLAIDAECLPL